MLPAGRTRDGTELSARAPRKASACRKDDIAATGSYDLSLNRYKEVEHEVVEHAAPAEIIAELRAIEAEIAEGLDRLEEMLG